MAVIQNGTKAALEAIKAEVAGTVRLGNTTSLLHTWHD